MITEWEIQIIERFMAILITLDEVKEDCGTPIIYEIDFEEREVIVEGPKEKRVIPVLHIMQSYQEEREHEDRNRNKSDVNRGPSS